MHLQSIQFNNYRAFQSAILPLQPLTLLLGPNSSGKSSALSAIQTMSRFVRQQAVQSRGLLPIGVEPSPAANGTLQAVWDNSHVTQFTWYLNRSPEVKPGGDPLAAEHLNWLSSGRLFELDSDQIAMTVPMVKTLEVTENGNGMPAVLTTLQDEWPERFEALNHDLRQWLPEFDRVLFDTPTQGQRPLALRTVRGKHKVPTSKLSAGTLLSLSLLSICHLPAPPAIIGLEEPDYGLHPRLLRQLKDSLLRLTMPKAFGEEREPVQVVISTHSPYLVDLFRDELESIVVLKKEGLYSTFSRLSDLEHVAEILKDAALGDAWYSGILGGVPVES